MIGLEFEILVGELLCLRLPSKQLPDSNKGQASEKEPRILVEDGNEEQDCSGDAKQPEDEAVVECVFGWWLHEMDDAGCGVGCQMDLITSFRIASFAWARVALVPSGLYSMAW